MDVNEIVAAQQREWREDNRNMQTNSAILSLANQQRDANCIQKQTNRILEEQTSELIKRNSYLELELSNAKKEAKFSRIINIIATLVALVSLIATILIAIFK